MKNVLRATMAGTALLVLAACAHDTTPTATPDTDLASLSLSPDVGAAPGQASLPGLMMSPDPTYQGSVSSADQCTWSATTGRVECAPVTRGGLTITRSIAFYDAAGAAQTHRDSTTRSVNTRVDVKGTVTTDKGTRTIDRSSSITVSGLGRESTRHTIDGTEHGTSSATLTTDRGTVTLSETFTASTAGLVVPAPFTAGSWPLAGTTTRQSTLTATGGSTTRSTSVSETVTYNGTSTATVVITRDGKTRNCTRDLSARTMTCS